MCMHILMPPISAVYITYYVYPYWISTFWRSTFWPFTRNQDCRHRLALPDQNHGVTAAKDPSQKPDCAICDSFKHESGPKVLHPVSMFLNVIVQLCMYTYLCRFFFLLLSVTFSSMHVTHPYVEFGINPFSGTSKRLCCHCRGTYLVPEARSRLWFFLLPEQQICQGRVGSLEIIDRVTGGRFYKRNRTPNCASEPIKSWPYL
jgi:hypothetical protein